MTKRLGIGPFDESMAERFAVKVIEDELHSFVFDTKIAFCRRFKGS
jgi:hypothetical protein